MQIARIVEKITLQYAEHINLFNKPLQLLFHEKNLSRFENEIWIILRGDLL